MEEKDDDFNINSIQDMSEYFRKKVHIVRECLRLRNIDSNSLKSYAGIEKGLEEVREIFGQIREQITAGEKVVIEMQNVQFRVQNINDRICHIQNNIPGVIQKKIPAPPKEEPVCGPVTQQKGVTKMKYVNMPEFDAVPKYMKGRLKYEQINKFVDEFNHALEAKYKFMSMPRKGMSAAVLKTWNKVKSQENAETKGLFFCTGDDLKDYGGMKFDRACTNFLTILRHCSKVKESRGPGNIVRFIVPS